MRVQPDAGELLRVARGELLETLLPHLPEAQRYTARMVANAMAIAARELRTPVAAVPVDEATLARQIRSGAHDGSTAILATLRDITARRLAVSNPRVLEGGRA
jgi:hypothetical protein